MDFLTAIDISTSGLDAQRIRMNTIAMNLANIHTTKTETGQPYRRKVPIFTTTPYYGQDASFRSQLGGSLKGRLDGVQVTDIVEDPSDFQVVYDPSHPDADGQGYVRLPNVNLMIEMVQMLTAKRSYEANVTALNAAKNMALKSLELLK